MASGKRNLHLFEGYGVELEYMIVSRKTIDIQPIAEKIFWEVSGEFLADIERGPIAWSNELVSHVLELKTNGPATTLQGLDTLFHENIREINTILRKYDAILLPSGAHPWMDPFKETVIWPHEFNEIYEVYDRIFDCRGHGWSNLQSTHINLPFTGDDEFARLHAAIRVVLPLIPALTASSPMLDGRLTGFTDSRLETYRHNQEKIPSIAGKVIPEQIFTKADYERQIFDKIRDDIRDYDTEGVLDKHFLNSRGAIARFDRGAIEIRIIDIQECPKADLAILSLLVDVIKNLVAEHTASFEEQKSWNETDLAEIFLGVIREGMGYHIQNGDYLKLFGMGGTNVVAKDFWRQLTKGTPANDVIDTILQHGNLSERITATLRPGFPHSQVQATYNKLAGCLETNRMFLPSS